MRLDNLFLNSKQEQLNADVLRVFLTKYKSLLQSLGLSFTQHFAIATRYLSNPLIENGFSTAFCFIGKFYDFRDAWPKLK